MKKWKHNINIIKNLRIDIQVYVDKPLVQNIRVVHLWGQKHQTTTTTTTTTTILNVCVPCSITTIFVWFCDLVYVALMVRVGQYSGINPNILKS
jgi:hypothetical protein